MHGNQAIRAVADQQEREFAEVARDSGAEVVCGSSLKMALDRDWDQPQEKEEALALVLHMLHTVEAWVQTLQQEEAELAQSAHATCEVGRRARCAGR